MSERRACRVLGTDRASVRYRATRPDGGVLRDRLKALAQERRRVGYRRLHLMLRREGHAVDRKRVQRIYREEGPTPPTPAQINQGHSLWLDAKQGGTSKDLPPHRHPIRQARWQLPVRRTASGSSNMVGAD